MHQVLYAATKAFISSFGASLAAEVRELGIDVLVFHPSPVATRFYDKVRSRQPCSLVSCLACPSSPAVQLSVLWLCKPGALSAFAVLQQIHYRLCVDRRPTSWTCSSSSR